MYLKFTTKSYISSFVPVISVKFSGPNSPELCELGIEVEAGVCRFLAAQPGTFLVTLLSSKVPLSDFGFSAECINCNLTCPTLTCYNGGSPNYGYCNCSCINNWIGQFCDVRRKNFLNFSYTFFNIFYQCFIINNYLFIFLFF